MSDSDDRPIASLLGETIGNYQIEAVLGIGGMGQVFRARHRLLDRPVALKLMHGHMAKDPSFQSRFRREARAAAALRHPHIVEIFDFDEVDGYAYLVMELITGGTFRELLSKGTAKDPNWSLGRGLDLVRQAADALAYAHGLGMVHRDIKPENLLLQHNPAGGLVLKVGDFGLARVADASSSFATQSGMAMGTLAYMAPEQAGGKELDGRADIYALGIILYELVTGQLPFEIKTITEAVFKHAFTPPPPLSSIRPETPEALEGLVLRCLAKLPEERFASAADLAAALRDVSGMVAPEMEAASAALPSTSTQIGTMVQGAISRPAPENRTLVGDTALPRIQVLNESGTLLQVVAVRPGGISVGRLSTNDLQLDATSVSRHHLQVTWDGTRVQATDLGSRSGTDLDGTRMTAQVAVEWPWGTLLKIGQYWLRLDAPTGREKAVGERTSNRPSPIRGAPPVPTAANDILPSGMHASAAMSGYKFSSSFVTTGQIGVIVEPEALTLTPGQTETIEVTLANMGNVADHLSLSVGNVPREWVQLPPTQQIGPWGQAIVRLMVTVPETANVAAGDYSVEIRARSRTNPDQGGKVLGRWTVRPFVRAEVQITPARVEGRGRGQYRVAVRNDGNASARFRLNGRDDDGLQYRFEPDQLSVAPGTSENATLVVEGDAPLFGASRAGRFEVLAQANEGGAAAVGAAQFVRVARLPLWAALVVALLLLGGVGIAAAAALNPQRSLAVAGVGGDLRTIVAQTAEVAVRARSEQETQVAGVLNQTSTAIALLPIAQRIEAETAQALAAQQTQTVLSQQRSAADAEAQQTVQAAQQTQQVVVEQQVQQTQAAAQSTAVVAGLPSPTPPPTATTIPPTVVASVPTNTIRPTAVLLPTSTPQTGVIAGVATATNTATNTPTATATNTPTSTSTPTATNTPSAGAATNTPTTTLSPTATPRTALITFGAAPTPNFLTNPFTVGATTNSDGAITYSVVGGPCTLVSASAGTFAPTGVGACVVQANTPATAKFTAVLAQQTITIAQGTPTLMFGAAPTPNLLSSSFVVSATTNPGGLTITYSVVSGPCTVNIPTAGAAYPTGAGTCVVKATTTATANLVSVSAQQNVTITKAVLGISWGNPIGITYGTALSNAQLNATVRTQGIFDVAGVFVYTPAAGTVLNAGNGQTLSVSFTPTDTANYETPAPRTVTINVAKANQAITFGALGGKTFGDAPFTVSATASSGLPVVFTVTSAPAGACTIAGNTVTIVGAGTCTVNADQAGDGNYNAAAQVQQAFTVNKGNQTIIINGPGTKTFPSPPITLTATGGASGNPVTFTAGPSAVCTSGGTNGATITIVATGTCNLTADQAGNGNYNAAPQATDTIIVN